MNLNGLVTHTHAHTQADLWPFCIAVALLARTVTSFITEDSDEGQQNERERRKKGANKSGEERGIKKREKGKETRGKKERRGED